MIQVAAVIIALLAIGGSLWSYNASLRAEGEARAMAEVEKQKRLAEEANTLKALEGERYALKLLEQAEARNRKQAAELSALRAQRMREDDERAKMDPEFRDWGDGVVASYATGRLRERAVRLTAAKDSRSVPVASGVEVAPSAAGAAAGPGDESAVTRIRRWFARHLGNGVDSGGEGSR